MKNPVEREAFEIQIQEFGQTPRQIFKTPHPKRSDPPAVDPSVVDVSAVDQPASVYEDSDKVPEVYPCPVTQDVLQPHNSSSSNDTNEQMESTLRKKRTTGDNGGDKSTNNMRSDSLKSSSSDGKKCDSIASALPAAAVSVDAKISSPFSGGSEYVDEEGFVTLGDDFKAAVARELQCKDPQIVIDRLDTEDTQQHRGRSITIGASKSVRTSKSPTPTQVFDREKVEKKHSFLGSVISFFSAPPTPAASQSPTPTHKATPRMDPLTPPREGSSRSLLGSGANSSRRGAGEKDAVVDRHPSVSPSTIPRIGSDQNLFRQSRTPSIEGQAQSHLSRDRLNSSTSSNGSTGHNSNVPNSKVLRAKRTGQVFVHPSSITPQRKASERTIDAGSELDARPSITCVGCAVIPASDTTMLHTAAVTSLGCFGSLRADCYVCTCSKDGSLKVGSAPFCYICFCMHLCCLLL